MPMPTFIQYSNKRHIRIARIVILVLVLISAALIALPVDAQDATPTPSSEPQGSPCPSMIYIGESENEQLIVAEFANSINYNQRIMLVGLGSAVELRHNDQLINGAYIGDIKTRPGDEVCLTALQLAEVLLRLEAKDYVDEIIAEAEAEVVETEESPTISVSLTPTFVPSATPIPPTPIVLLVVPSTTATPPTATVPVTPTPTLTPASSTLGSLENPYDLSGSERVEFTLTFEEAGDKLYVKTCDAGNGCRLELNLTSNGLTVSKLSEIPDSDAVVSPRYTIQQVADGELDYTFYIQRSDMTTWTYKISNKPFVAN